MHFNKTFNVINSHPIRYSNAITHLTWICNISSLISMYVSIGFKLLWCFPVTVKQNKGYSTVARCRAWRQQIARQNKLVITRGDVHYVRDLRAAPAQIANISFRW